MAWRYIISALQQLLQQRTPTSRVFTDLFYFPF